MGGIPEIVEDGVTGSLVPFEPVSGTESDPADPGRFARDLAGAITALVDDPQRARQMGEAARRRVADHFSWPVTARRVVEIYRRLALNPELTAALWGGPLPSVRPATRR